MDKHIKSWVSVFQRMSSKYVCTLDDASLKKAREELNEIPSDRMAAIQALRDWVQQQPHFTLPDFGMTL